MADLEQSVYDDLLLAQEVFGSEFIYEKHGDQMIAVQFNEDGDEIARYNVKVSLKEL